MFDFNSPVSRPTYLLSNALLPFFFLQNTEPRGIIEVNKCLSIKGAEDAINKPFAFEISTTDSNMYFVADSDKEKEDWINAVGRAIVRHSKSVLDNEQLDY